MMQLGLILFVFALIIGTTINYFAKQLINKKLNSLQDELESHKSKNGSYPNKLEDVEGFLEFMKPNFTYEYDKTESGYSLTLVGPPFNKAPGQRYTRTV